MIEARELCKFYRAGTPGEVRAVDGVSLAVESGSITILSGPSGYPFSHCAGGRDVAAPL